MIEKPIRMLNVDHYELIRRKHLIEGLSNRAIWRDLARTGAFA